MSRGVSVEHAQHELQIGSEHSIVDWNQYCRDIAVSHFVNNPVQIGGPGHIVEIDKSLFSRGKYNRGRIVPEQWIFGGYDPATEEGFLLPVPRRNAATLMPLHHTVGQAGERNLERHVGCLQWYYWSRFPAGCCEPPI